jgi:pseudouridine-5'-phosphate glycosidase
MGGAGTVLAQPCPADVAVPAVEFDAWLQVAEREANRLSVTGAALTPFLLKRIAERSNGRTLIANRKLIVANAQLAAEVATALAGPVG